MRMQIQDVISRNDRKKTAEITTVYQGKTYTRHCVSTSAGYRGHHPDTDGVNRMKMAVARLKRMEEEIVAHGALLRKTGVTMAKEVREMVEKDLDALIEQLPAARTEAGNLQDLYPEFVLYGG